MVVPLQNMRSTMPAMAVSPVSVAVDSSLTQPLPPLNSDRQMTHPVMLVPRMEPSTIPMACRNFIMPEFTNPMAITEVAEEDWMTMVTTVPSRIPFQVLLVSL